MSAFVGDLVGLHFGSSLASEGWKFRGLNQSSLVFSDGAAALILKQQGKRSISACSGLGGEELILSGGLTFPSSLRDSHV